MRFFHRKNSHKYKSEAKSGWRGHGQKLTSSFHYITSFSPPSPLYFPSELVCTNVCYENLKLILEDERMETDRFSCVKNGKVEPEKKGENKKFRQVLLREIL